MSTRHAKTRPTRKTRGQAAPSRRYTLNDTRSPGIVNMVLACTYVVALGTTAGAAVKQMFAGLRSRFPHRLPDWIQYLLLDAAADQDDRHHGHVPDLGIDGSGTDPRQGRAIFQKSAARISQAIKTHLDGLVRSRSGIPLKSARECVNVVIVAGCGGTSGGFLDPLISLLHERAQQRNIQAFRVHLLLVTPEMVLGDVSRELTPEQQEMISLTFAQNLQRTLAAIGEAGHWIEAGQDGGTFLLPPGGRIYSLDLVGNSNGQTELSTCGDLSEMLGLSLYLRHCSPISLEIPQRHIDLVQLGVTGHPVTVPTLNS